MRRIDFLRGGGFAFAGLVAGSTIGGQARPAAGATTIPNLAVVDQHGRRLAFYDDLIRGRAVLLNFFFTSCSDTCPLVTQNLREVQDLLGPRMGTDIFMISVSLQPALETPAVLRDYAEQWEVRPGWSFLTGHPDDLELLRRATGFANADPAYVDERDSHLGMVRYGNDRLDRWSSTAGLGRPAWIAKTVALLADMG